MASFLHSFTLPLLLLCVISSALAQERENAPRLRAVDLDALLSIKNSLTDLPGSSFFSSWDFAALDPCSSFSWVGCSISSDSELLVTSLSLGSGLAGSLGLGGSLPASLVQLTELTQLVLNPGLVTGPIPPQLGRLTSVRLLSLSHNRFTGPVPATLTTLHNLHTLDLSFNILIGTIPPGLLTQLTRLKVLILAGNQLTGELPSPGESTQLLHLDLKSNQLMGPIPPTLPLSLRYVSLSQNRMWGSIKSLESLSELVYLDLSVNQFSGTIHGSLFRPALSTLLLSRNNFSGKITSCAGSAEYPQGSVIDLSHNGLSGGLLEAAAGAETIFLNNKKFTGAVPGSYYAGLAQGRIKTLYLQHNFLESFTKSPRPALPDKVEVCLAYNYMVPPVGLEACPTGAGNQLFRPAAQCSVLRNH